MSPIVKIEGNLISDRFTGMARDGSSNDVMIDNSICSVGSGDMYPPIVPDKRKLIVRRCK